MAKRHTDSDWINPATLDNKTRQELWAGLQQLEPSLATLLQTDPNLSALKQTFGATVRFTRDKAAAYVRAGRKILEEKRNATNNTSH